jgi:4-nitrophenylphosphatase
MNFPFQLFRRHLDKADINTLMKIKVFLFDCDGVLWKGAKPISGAVETVKYLKDKGKSVFYCVSVLCLAFPYRQTVLQEAEKVLWKN